MENLNIALRWAKSHPRALIVGVIFVWIACAGAWNAFHPPTPQQIKEEELESQAVAQRAQQREAQAAQHKAEQQYICELKEICSEYATVRQDCAVAGNFDNCVSIKMGSERAALVDECSEDGGVQYSTSDAPGKVDCFFVELNKMLSDSK